MKCNTNIQLLISSYVINAEYIHINFHCVCLSATADQPWQIRYQIKAHNPGKVEIIYVNVVLSIGGSTDAKIGAAHYV